MHQLVVGDIDHAHPIAPAAHEPGALQLARRAGAPIVPLTVQGRGCLQLRTWDRTLAPLPWARLEVRVHAPIEVPEAADAAAVEQLAAELAAALTCSGGQA